MIIWIAFAESDFGKQLLEDHVIVSFVLYLMTAALTIIVGMVINGEPGHTADVPSITGTNIQRHITQER
jgi:hypothetical protein